MSWFENWIQYDNTPFVYWQQASYLHPGDVLHIHWPTKSGHSMVVVGKTSSGDILLSAHTNNRWNYPFSSVEQDSGSQATYLYMHVNGNTANS